ncbi:hypothetical protein O6H91_10G073500 [Diphasiastrum complanatum]|uniref:Uncharacterized protein n=1 Tax=Diphasiastrum complanatum TaxID=34168 RepID=A0ACC2CIF0_DIPCM|nr:hypothetical protein O6H91_10G073500 [Diphasiastrum complanatum]
MWFLSDTFLVLDVIDNYNILSLPFLPIKNKSMSPFPYRANEFHVFRSLVFCDSLTQLFKLLDIVLLYRVDNLIYSRECIFDNNNYAVFMENGSSLHSRTNFNEHINIYSTLAFKHLQIWPSLFTVFILTHTF